MGFTDFFQGQPAPPPQHNPEPPGFDLIRDMLMRKAFGLESDPYGYGATQPSGFSTGLINAPAFGGQNFPNYPTSQTSGSGGGGGDIARMLVQLVGGGNMQRVPRTLPPRPLAPMASGLSRYDAGPVPGARVPISVKATPPPSAGMSAPTSDVSALVEMLGTPRRFFDGYNYDGEHHYTPPDPANPMDAINNALMNHNWAQVQQLARQNPHSTAGAMPRGATGSYQDPYGQTRWLLPGMAGRRTQFGSLHTMGYYDPTGRIVPVAEQNGITGNPGRLWAGSGPQYQHILDMIRRTGGFGGFTGPQPQHQPTPAPAPPVPILPPPGGGGQPQRGTPGLHGPYTSPSEPQGQRTALVPPRHRGPGVVPTR